MEKTRQTEGDEHKITKASLIKTTDFFGGSKLLFNYNSREYKLEKVQYPNTCWSRFNGKKDKSAICEK